MKFITRFSAFRSDESGAITVDWMVITASIIGLAIATLGVIADGSDDATGDINAELVNDHIQTTF